MIYTGYEGYTKPRLETLAQDNPLACELVKRYESAASKCVVSGDETCGYYREGELSGFIEQLSSLAGSMRGAAKTKLQNIISLMESHDYERFNEAAYSRDCLKKLVEKLQ